MATGQTPAAAPPPTATAGAPAGAGTTGVLSLTVVICAYTLERWDDLQAALVSLRHQTRPPDQIVLVSDYNPDLLTRVSARSTDVTCLPNTGPRGLSGARNTGMAAATGEIVAFLDDDAVPESDWVERLLEAYSEDRVIGVGGGVVPNWRAPRPAWLPEEFLWVVGCSYEGQPRERAEVRNPIGANMSFRREVLLALGGFADGIGRVAKDAAGCEETELSIRARRGRAGARILLEPEARCWHTVTAERVTRRYFRRRCLGEGRSKAAVSRLVGSDSALSSERTYVLRTLPRGVVRGLRDLLSGEMSGGARAWAILEGTALTAASYAVCRVRAAWVLRRAGDRSRPGA